MQDQVPARCLEKPERKLFARENSISLASFGMPSATSRLSSLQSQGEVLTPAVFYTDFFLGRENKPAQRNPSPLRQKSTVLLTFCKKRYS